MKNKPTKTPSQTEPKKFKNSTKDTWENIVKNNEKMISEAWKAKNPQKDFSSKIRKLYKKYKNSNNKKK
jgi:hypothetical protein